MICISCFTAEPVERERASSPEKSVASGILQQTRCCFFVSLWKFFFRRFPEVFRRYFNNIIYLFPLFQEIQSHSSYLPTKPSLVSSGSGANQLTAQMNGQIYSPSPLSLNPRETSPSPCMYLRPADLRTGDSTSPPVPPHRVSSIDWITCFTARRRLFLVPFSALYWKQGVSLLYDRVFLNLRISKAGSTKDCLSLRGTRRFLVIKRVSKFALSNRP